MQSTLDLLQTIVTESLGPTMELTLDTDLVETLSLTDVDFQEICIELRYRQGNHILLDYKRMYDMRVVKDIIAYIEEATNVR